VNDENVGLPSGWVLTELGALSERRGGGTPSRSVKRYFQGNIPCLTVTDLPPIGAAPPTVVASREAIPTKQSLRHRRNRFLKIASCLQHAFQLEK
jgi:hypothetical protein